MTHKFKVGDKVRCVRANFLLSEGHVYKVTAVDCVWITVRDSDGTHVDALAERFELVTPAAPVENPAVSEEAREMARELMPSLTTYRARVAAALQKLMDERDRMQDERNKAIDDLLYSPDRQRADRLEQELTSDAARYEETIKAVRARAEAAEAKLARRSDMKAEAMLRKATEEWKRRAEAAEKDRDFWQRSHKTDLEAFGAWVRRAQAAESRLAECVREVYEAHQSEFGYRPCWLQDILNKYTSADIPKSQRSDPPEHPDTVRLRELVDEIRDYFAGEMKVRPVLEALLDKYEVKS